MSLILSALSKIRRILAKYSGCRYVEHLTCWNQFLAMMFGLLDNRESLRYLIVALENAFERPLRQN